MPERARLKLLESFPNQVRAQIETARRRVTYAGAVAAAPDPRIAAFLGAIRDGRIVRIRLERPAAREIHPVMLIAGPDSWQVVDAAAAFEAIPLAECGSINISARRFSATAR